MRRKWEPIVQVRPAAAVWERNGEQGRAFHGKDWENPAILSAESHRVILGLPIHLIEVIPM
jgi:hypothetical protein